MNSIKREQSSLWKPLAITLGSVAIIYAINIIVIFNVLPEDWATRGTIGDSFGILNSIFTALAFAAVIVSLWYQRKELQSTLEEVQASEQSHSESLRAQEQALIAMKEQTIAFYRPYIVARLELKAGTAIQLVIENTGKTAAKNLQLQTDLNFVYPGGQKYGNLSEAYAFNNIIDSFAPKQRVVYHLALGSAIHNEDANFEQHPPQFSIIATYSSLETKEWKESLMIDMRTFRNSVVDEPRIEKALMDIAKHTETINRTLDRKLSKS